VDHPHRDAPAEADLGDLLMRVARTLRRRGVAATAPWDLSPHQVRALRVVARHERIRPGELAAHLRVAPRSVTDVVDALEERGLVTRAPDPSDRRATVVTLTASGTQLVRETDAARREDADAYFARLSDRDRATLRRILETLDESGPTRPGQL
jgi:DNA-binding MarR family transcriptional regulator